MKMRLLTAFVAIGVATWGLCSLGYSAGIVPHSACNLWTRQLVIEHAIGDVITWAAYMGISARALFIVQARKDLPLRGVIGGVVLCTALFVAACGFGHFIDQAVVWFGGAPFVSGQWLVWFSAKLRLGTAAVSAGTLVILYEFTPGILGLTSPAQLMAANAELADRSRDLELALGRQRELEAAEIERAVLAERTRAQAEQIAMQQARIDEMSTPILPITDQVVVMPLVGAIDAHRAERIVQIAIEGAEHRRVRAMIVDMTSIGSADTLVIQMLADMAKALHLLGTRVILTGIRGPISLAMVRLGVDLPGIPIRATLQQGVAIAVSNT